MKLSGPYWPYLYIYVSSRRESYDELLSNALSLQCHRSPAECLYQRASFWSLDGTRCTVRVKRCQKCLLTKGCHWFSRHARWKVAGENKSLHHQLIIGHQPTEMYCNILQRIVQSRSAWGKLANWIQEVCSLSPIHHSDYISLCHQSNDVQWWWHEDQLVLLAP